MAVIRKEVLERRNFYVDSGNTFNLFKLDRDITKLPSIDVHVVRDDEVERPWLISERIYGQPRLWWFIMKYNRIKRPEQELVAGMALEFPDIADYYVLYDRYFKL